MKRIAASLLVLLVLATPASAIEVVAAGDIATSGNGDTKTSDLVLALDPKFVFTLGDHAYPDGSLNQFQKYYAPTWGRFKDRTFPAPGNHDYHTPGAQGYRDYFSIPPAFHTYLLDADRDDERDWFVIQMDSSRKVSEQRTYLAQKLSKDNHLCELIYWHHPRFSSGEHGSNALTDPWWDVAYAHGVDVILNGHDHNYERFATLNPAGKPVADGIREYVVGTGGANTRPFPGGVVAGSQKRLTGNANWGVLHLELRPTSYTAEFRRATGGTGTVADTSSGECHA